MKSNIYNNMKTISLFFIISLLINGAVTESVTSIVGYSLTLHTNTVIQSNDVIEWRYKDELIAKLDRGSISVFNGSDGRFSDGLKINNQTGDLTIIDFTIQLIGEYRLHITGEKTTTKTFSVSGLLGFKYSVTSLSVMEGESVSLNTGVPETEEYDVIRWRFGNSPLAEINRKTEIISTHYDVHDERFRDRLKLDDWSGDLTITNITTDLSGLYEVNVAGDSGTHTIHQSYTVTVSDEVKSVSVMEGDSVTLHTDLTDIQIYDVIEWRFGSQKSVIATISGGAVDMNRQAGRFRDRLKLDDQTGSLTITNIIIEDSEVYEVKIRQVHSRRSIQKRFLVTVSDAGVSLGGSCVGVLLVFVLSQMV